MKSKKSLIRSDFDKLALLDTDGWNHNSHHLPFEIILQKMKSGLKTDGILIVLDLYQPEGIRDFLINLVTVPVNMILKLSHTGRLRDPQEIREAWVEHGKHDAYLPVSQVRKICYDLLPGAIIKKHLLWRYSIVWQKRKTKTI